MSWGVLTSLYSHSSLPGHTNASSTAIMSCMSRRQPQKRMRSGARLIRQHSSHVMHVAAPSAEQDALWRAPGQAARPYGELLAHMHSRTATWNLLFDSPPAPGT